MNHGVFTAILWLLAFASALMPFYQYEAHSFLLAFILLSVALFWQIATLKTSPEIPKSPLILLGSAFWVLALVSAVASEVTQISYIYFCFFSVLPLSVLVFLLSADKPAFLKTIAIGLGMIFAVLSVFSLVQFFMLPEWLFKGLVHWPLANPNSLAGLLSLAFFGAFGLMLGAEKKLHANLALLLSVLLLAALFITGSRGALLCLMGGLVLFAVPGFAHIKKHVRCVSILAVSGVLIFAALAVTGPAESVQLSQLWGRTVAGSNDMLWTRPDIWSAAAEMIKDRPLLGTGIGTFFLYYPAYRIDPWTSGMMVHSDPLQFTVEMGVLAPVLFYSFILLAVIRTGKALRVLKAGDPQGLLILIPLCALAAMVAHAHITFHFNVLSILFFAGALLAAWFSATQQVLKTASLPVRGPIPVVKGALIIPLVVATLLFVQMQGSEILVNRAKERMIAGDLGGFAADVNLAGELSGNRNARALILAASIPLGILENNAGALKDEQVRALFDQGSALLERAAERNPRVAAPFYYRARLIVAAGPRLPDNYTEEAAYFLQAGLRVDPLHLGSRLLLAQIAAGRGDKSAALDILKDGLKWRYIQQDPERYYQYTAQLSLEQGDMETHKDVMDKISRIKHGRAKRNIPASAVRDFKNILPEN